MSTCYIVSMEKDLTTLSNELTEIWTARNEAFIAFANLHLDPNADMLEYSVAIADALKAKEAYEAAEKAFAERLNQVTAG